MKVIVIGAGLIGVTTAYILKRRGHDVLVIERQGGAGRETSFANGAMLSPSMPEPWNSPGSWRVLLNSIFRSDASLQLRLLSLPALARWGVEFLKNSSPAHFELNTVSNLRLALDSLKVMQSLNLLTAIEYGGMASGSLRIFRDRTALDRAIGAAHRLTSQGLSYRVLSSADTVKLEPALGPIADHLAGAIYYPADEIGDAYRFCVALAGHAHDLGVEFCFGTEVSSLEVRSDHVIAALGKHKRFTADRYVVGAGSYSTPLLQRIGIHLPVRPAKGYSITVNSLPGDGALRIPIVDDHLHAVVVPLGGAIRAAGTAEFAGYDLALPRARVDNLLTLLRQVLPQMSFDLAAAKPWCGLRAMSADGVPIIGSTPLSNLFVNTGHGHLGWTMAAGSAQLLTALLSGDVPSIDPMPYALTRFTAARTQCERIQE
jgi:D-amino-acid dehydrogenase